MISLRMEDLKDFTAKLFTAEVFDRWLLREASVTTFNVFTIDGRIRQGYYTEQELEERQIEELSSWKVIRPICFSLIRGKKLPEGFRITLQLAPAEAETFLKNVQTGIRPEQVAGLYLHIRYEEGILRCVTGVSLQVFTLDRQLEFEWDEAVKRYLKRAKAAYMVE